MLRIHIPPAFVSRVATFDRVRRRLQKLVYITQNSAGCAGKNTGVTELPP